MLQVLLTLLLNMVPEIMLERPHTLSFVGTSHHVSAPVPHVETCMQPRVGTSATCRDVYATTCRHVPHVETCMQPRVGTSATYRDVYATTCRHQCHMLRRVCNHVSAPVPHVGTYMQPLVGTSASYRDIYATTCWYQCHI